MLFSSLLVLFPFTAKLLKRVTLLSPAPFLRCLLNPPHWLSPPSLPQHASCRSYQRLIAKFRRQFLVLFVLVPSAPCDPRHPSFLNLFFGLPGPLFSWLSPSPSPVAPSLLLLLVPPHQTALLSTQSSDVCTLTP